MKSKEFFYYSERYMEGYRLNAALHAFFGGYRQVDLCWTVRARVSEDRRHCCRMIDQIIWC